MSQTPPPKRAWRRWRRGLVALRQPGFGRRRRGRQAAVAVGERAGRSDRSPTSAPATPRRARRGVARTQRSRDLWSGGIALAMALLMGALGAFVGAEYERTRVPVYQSSALLLLDDAAAVTSDPGRLFALSQQVPNYASLAQTDLITVPVGARVGLPRGVVATRVRAVVLDAVNLTILILARGGSPESAQALAGAVAGQLDSYVSNEQAALPVSVPPEFRLHLVTVGQARPGVRISPNHRRELLTGLVVGVISVWLSYALAWSIIGDPRPLVAAMNSDY